MRLIVYDLSLIHIYEAVGDKIMQVGITPVGTGVELSRECLNSDGTPVSYTHLAPLSSCPCRWRVYGLRLG